MQIYKYCHCLLFVNAKGKPITEYLPADHPGRDCYGLVRDPTPNQGHRCLINASRQGVIHKREVNLHNRTQPTRNPGQHRVLLRCHVGNSLMDQRSRFRRSCLIVRLLALSPKTVGFPHPRDPRRHKALGRSGTSHPRIERRATRPFDCLKEKTSASPRDGRVGGNGEQKR